MAAFGLGRAAFFDAGDDFGWSTLLRFNSFSTGLISSAARRFLGAAGSSCSSGSSLSGSGYGSCCGSWVDETAVSLSRRLRSSSVRRFSAFWSFSSPPWSSVLDSLSAFFFFFLSFLLAFLSLVFFPVVVDFGAGFGGLLGFGLDLRFGGVFFLLSFFLGGVFPISLHRISRLNGSRISVSTRWRRLGWQLEISLRSVLTRRRRW